MAESEQEAGQGGVHTPRPDPTERTREELLREIAHLRELVEAQLRGHKDFATTRHADLLELVSQRIDATERHFDLHLNEARHQLQDAIEAERRQTEAALVSSTEATSAALEAATKAINKAEEATEKRFDAVNEFRAQLTDQNATFLRREMFEQHVRESLENKQAMQGRIETNTRELVALAAMKTGGEDKTAQARANLASFFAAIATLVAIGTLIVAVVAMGT